MQRQGGPLPLPMPCREPGPHSGSGRSLPGPRSVLLSGWLCFQGLQVRAGLHQAQSGDLHRPAEEGKGGARLAAGREDLLHPPAERAGGPLHPGAGAGCVLTHPPSPTRCGHLLCASPSPPWARSTRPGPPAPSIFHNNPSPHLLARHHVGIQQVLPRCTSDAFP